MTLNVGPKNSEDHLVAMDLLLNYQLIDGLDIHLTYYNEHDLYLHYGDEVQIAILVRSHPDLIVNNLLNKRLSKLLETRRFNNGNIYHIDLDEETFYKTYPYFSKMNLDKETLKKYYTNLILLEDTTGTTPSSSITTTYRSRFINTLGIKYYLMSNQQTSNEADFTTSV